MTPNLCRFPGIGIALQTGNAQRVRTRAIQGLVLAAAIAASAMKVRALSTSGAVATMLIGAAVHAGMGARGSVAMVSYFASATALGRLPRSHSSEQRRGNRRDAVQVLANGGPPALFSLLHARAAAPAKERAAVAFYGSLAAAAADTWATEVGTRFGGQPRSLATGKSAAPGDSGAITIAGLAASVVASSAMAQASRAGGARHCERIVSCAAGGLAGSLADSVLGAFMQEHRRCELCGARTEMMVHSCGHHSRYLSGIRGVNNDVVNVLGVTVGGLAAAALFAALPHLTGRNGSRVEFATTMTNSRSAKRAWQA